MKHINKMSKFIRDEYIIKLPNDISCYSGDIISFSYKPYQNRKFYTIIEYTKFKDKIVILLHNYSTSYHTFFLQTIPNNLFSPRLYYRSISDELDKSTSNQVLLDNITKKYFVEKEKHFDLNMFENLSVCQWFIHTRRGVIHRSNWNNLPELEFEGLYAQANTSQYSYIKLQKNNLHEEYIWKQKMH